MDKLMSLSQAVERCVPDGSSLVLGACQEAVIPFAVGHELIRQQRQDLTLIAPISDMLFDQLIGAGCVARVAAGWVGNVSAGLGHCFRRAVERGIPRPLELHDYSNFTLGLAMLAAALGAPFIPTRTILGSDILQTNPGLIQGPNPLDPEGDPLVFVRPLRPDVAVLHVQRADSQGHFQLWGNLGLAVEAALAADRILITAEDLVPSEVILAQPNLVPAPAHKVAAVVHEPGGSHPSPVAGYCERDHEAFHDYHVRTRSVEGYQAWAEEWVLGVPDRQGYLRKLGHAAPAAGDS
jgi:glutaconate CoA-transferase, subunit A